ncbi:UDP-glucose 4-epimerase family protein [Paracidovorax wautersii]|uniref:UDP-glucose 4-epimerase n=1 Tax=Paracidovorax wautersii TaxID=1177982 RepID=A0A1I2CJL5_9BURK|nr:SDR family oxidoreductase [Paracidovorax wautersii]SFE68428.1 UDP-glucose 4-epimerase [Paracidovorax wautersii]
MRFIVIPERILITGATGFVGSALCARLAAEGLAVRGALREPPADSINSEVVFTGDLSATQDWSLALAGISCVVHAAARVHVMNDTELDPLAAFRAANVEGTLNLARQAAAAGVNRFVFISSIKVNGERTPKGRPFRSDDTPSPLDPYGVSKMEAEQGLRQIASETTMGLVIVRPPLVYGPGVRANFRQMLSAIQRGLPLPLASVDNRRSMVGLGNLIDLLLACILHPNATGHTFLVSDGDDISTPVLLQRVGTALNRPARLLPAPPALLRFLANAVGRKDTIQRLCESLQVDITHTRHVLGWKPSHSMAEELSATVSAYLREK